MPAAKNLAGQTFWRLIDELARDAVSGESYCTEQSTEEVDAYSLDSCVLEFFNVSEDESEDDQT